MFNKSPVKSKVNFIDEHLENVVSENAILRSKLQSKVEALSIMSKQLDKCLAEKDNYELLVEQLQLRHPPIIKAEIDPSTFFDNSDFTNKLSGAQLLANTREHNKLLTIEVETLKHKLEEAEEDIKVLRKGNGSQKALDKSFGMNVVNALSFEREELVLQLELANKKIEQMQNDLKSMLDEKEDLINERDAYKCKLHRLNHELMVALSKNKTPSTEKTKPNLLLDIDALVMENRYLQERLTQAQAEKELATHALTKYKSILETKQQKGLLKLGTNNINSVVSHKQVKQLLESGTTQELPVTAATIADLRALSFGLLDALNDKSLALSHQKKANRILATRISDLEKKLECGTDSEDRISVFPSKVLLESYCSSDVDRYKIEDETITVNVQQPIDEEYECENIKGKMKNNENVQEYNFKIENSTNNEESPLPPELQKLVQEALDNMYLEDNQ